MLIILQMKISVFAFDKKEADFRKEISQCLRGKTGAEQWTWTRDSLGQLPHFLIFSRSYEYNETISAKK